MLQQSHQHKLCSSLQVSHPSAAVRHQSCRAMAALAAVQPAAAARMLEGLLDLLEASTLLLAGRRPEQPTHVPHALLALQGKSQGVLEATAHGTALAGAALLMVRAAAVAARWSHGKDCVCVCALLMVSARH